MPRSWGLNPSEDQYPWVVLRIKTGWCSSERGKLPLNLLDHKVEAVELRMFTQVLSDLPGRQLQLLAHGHNIIMEATAVGLEFLQGAPELVAGWSFVLHA